MRTLRGYTGAITALHCVTRKEVWDLVGDREAILPGYADTDTGTRYGDTPIRHFSKNKDTVIRQYI